MFNTVRTPKRVSQDVYLRGISQHQHLNRDKISIVIVPSDNPMDSRGVSYKVSREMGIKIARRLSIGHACFVVVKQRQGFVVKPVITVINDPTYQLNYAMRWVYQVMLGGQFSAEYTKELEYVNSLGG